MSLHEDEWQKAQNVKISLDLITDAKSQLQFLARVDAHPRLFDRAVLERAIERYESCWLPLVGTTSNTKTKLIPPLDCAWIWHCHRLNPVQYAEDCNRLFGRIVDAPLVSKNDTNDFTMEVWKAQYPKEPYALDLYGNMTTKYSGRPRNITHDLVEAVLKQQTFCYQVSEPHYLEESFLAAAVMRYKGFLYLKSKHVAAEKSPIFVPTFDIKLMWHTHQLSPICYQRDIAQKLWRILDDTDSNRNVGGNLGFIETCTLWQNTYGTPYEKAGCMFRGEPPHPIPQQEAQAINSNTMEKSSGEWLDVPIPHLINSDELETLVKSSGEWLDSQKVHLRSRRMIKVHLAVRGAKASNRSVLFVRLKALKGLEALKLEERSSSHLEWKHVWTFEIDVLTEGVVLELRSQRHGISKVFLVSKKLGELIITWKMVLETQSLGAWFPLTNTKEASASLQVFISVTPPVVGPYLLRSVRARPTGDDKFMVNSTSVGLWLTWTVLDHTHKEVYIVRSRLKMGGFSSSKKLPEAEKVVHVHLGGWNYKGSSNFGHVSGIIAGSARQIGSGSWSLLDGLVVLTIREDPSDPNWNLIPQFDVGSSEHGAIMLLSGRKLHFSVAGLSDKEEAGFVTLVRCTRDAPSGTATALFNWKTGSMQIKHEENVVLVLLLLTTIGLSMSELLTIHSERRDLTNFQVDWGGTRGGYSRFGGGSGGYSGFGGRF